MAAPQLMSGHSGPLVAAGDPQLQPLAPNSPGNAFEGGHKRVKVQYTGVEAVWGVR
eukprot:CAMPEP_0174361046 /NCGR_PEP_ID=MMETSP0811_2-20130205/57475_1 /TAXON_ID=73025 ORGANISM="Eutreptiella gymnastica-like, Strain CCMP1594" /NCGR_SAMPLE_ID=MMETSP0811_2 /ASSEMBLY_ACC=CAM_ASM_000667 /LENGTH=55 /DNA_ID=CAMNT_0015497385 /DNA_START=160 /DNA_END=324 /DNA_ORIENTATION=+